MGITTHLTPFERFSNSERQYPPCLSSVVPPEPNDDGTNLIKLTYYQSLLAPPPRGPITQQSQHGEKTFDKLQCSVCHTPIMYTAPLVKVPHPNSPAPRLWWMEVKALENQPVRAYSDFLVHPMGRELADGLSQNGAKSGEWRTTPLWGLHMRRFYMHDGRTKDLGEAITLHGGQAAEVAANYKKLPQQDKEDLLAFLKSL